MPQIKNPHWQDVYHVHYFIYFLEFKIKWTQLYIYFILNIDFIVTQKIKLTRLKKINFD